MVIFSVSGSLRKNSSNSVILNTMKALTPKGVEFIIYDNLGGLPHFNPDLDNDENLPIAVKELRGMLNRSSVIIISTPEYAHGIPGSLKNALDWLVSTTVIDSKPIGLLLGSASEGNYAKDSLIEILKTMNGQIVPDFVTSIVGVQAKVDDPQTWHKLKDFVENLVLSAHPKS